MHKILITGGAGYIGSKLTEFFLKKNYQVTVIDNLMHKKNTVSNFFINSNFKFTLGDVRNEILINDIIKKNDIIIPLACIVGAPLCDKMEKDAYEINEASIKNLTKKISKNQIIIFPTTNSGYGITEKESICTEEMDLYPISHYAKTKVNAEKILMELENIICLRLATVFGVSYRNRIDLLVNYFVYNSVKYNEITLYQPHFRRNFIHVQDVVNTFAHCLDNFNTMKSNIYNVGLSHANLTKLELCEKIKEQNSLFKILINENEEDPDKRDYFVSNQKLENTGWESKISLKEGIKELIKSYSISSAKEFDKNI